MLTGLFFSFITAGIFFIGLVGLILEPIRVKYYVVLFMCFFMCAQFISSYMQHLTAFIYIGLIIIVIFINCKRRLLNICLSLIGYMITLVINHCIIIPLSLFNISIKMISTTYALPFIFFDFLLSFIIIFLVRFILKRMQIFSIEDYQTKRLQFVFIIELLIGILFLVINFTFGERVGYTSKNLIFNGSIILLFLLVSLVLFTYLLKTLKEDSRLKQFEKEQVILSDYLNRMEAFYDEIRSFRHDYLNILVTMQIYIDENNMTYLKEYFYNNILPTRAEMEHKGFDIAKLSKIKNPELKSLLYSKLIRIENQHINFKLELRDTISQISMEPIKLERIIGIILDNAMEAALIAEVHFIQLAILDTEEATIFLLQNSTPPIQEAVSQLFKKGYTTKQQHSGLGLYTVKELVDTMQNVIFSVTIDTYFEQRLEIKKL